MSDETERDWQLAQFEDYEDGWNGEGSLAPNATVWRNARAILPIVPTDWNATLNDNGTITFDSSNPGGDYAAIEVGQTRIAMMIRNGEDRIFVNGEITAPVVRVSEKGTQ